MAVLKEVKLQSHNLKRVLTEEEFGGIVEKTKNGIITKIWKDLNEMNDLLKGKKAIVIGERDGVQGPSIVKCLQAAGAEIIFSVTECFVWTAAGTMDAKNQANIKKIAESGSQEDKGTNNIIVVLGASDIEGAEISAETVTVGDPSFAGPLAGVSLGLPVYHILESDLKDAIPENVYDENVGIWSMAVDIEEIDKRFQAIREKSSKGISSEK